MLENNSNAAPTPTAPFKILRNSIDAGCCGNAASIEEAAPNASEEIKKKVQSYYAERVQSPAAGCCVKTSAGADPITALAGYDRATLDAVPENAAEKSFGCGDPLKYAGVQAGQTVLDIGSGAGIDCFIASQKVGPTGNVIGLDMTPAMLDNARRNAKEGGYANVEFRQGDAENMPVDDNSVDWVISNCVINLAPDKGKVFAEIRRVLKPGGRLSVSDIVADELPQAVRRDALAYCGCVGGAIATDEYLALLTQAGLVDVRVDSRFDYEPEQIAAMILEDSSLKGQYGSLLEGNRAILDRVKVASIKVVGRKPGVNEKPIYKIERLQAEHVGAVQALLTENHLPLDGLTASLNDAFVATHNGFVIGAVTMERYDLAGLLRSFVVANGWRGHGVGKAVGTELIKHAAATGIQDVYLLTTTIQDLAAHFGFREIRREQAPAAVRESVEFRLQQCDSAVVMKMNLPSQN
jgi:SAM-dependent methyltransferase/N-acetylglutamate synthase-like GNAT family acetyltransferase